MNRAALPPCPLKAMCGLSPSCRRHLLLWRRNPFGHEPPEVTQELLTQGWYRPRPGQDVWACGMCMADMMAAKRPRQHLRHLNHPALAAERASSQRDISQLPMHEAYYRYLKGLGDCNVAYEQQVGLLSYALHCLPHGLSHEGSQQSCKLCLEPVGGVLYMQN